MKIGIARFGFLLTLLLVLFSSQIAAQSVTVLVNPSYNPFSYEDNGELKGLAVDLLNLISEETGLPMEMIATPFEEGFARLQSEGAYALPTLVFTSARKPLFNWVGPIAINTTYLYGLENTAYTVATIEDAKSVGKIGVVKDYYSQQLLQSYGFENLVVYENEKQLLKSLFDGLIDLAPFNSIVLTHLLKDESDSMKPIPTVLVDLDMTYIGFSRGVKADDIERWQEALDGLKRSGRFSDLYSKWLPDHPVPGIYTFLTEEYPPVTFVGEDGEVSGFVTDIVRELMKRNDISGELLVVPWSIGYDIALNLPNVLLFSMDRTESRESLFEWIGPVGKNTAYLYGRIDSNLLLPADISKAKEIPSIATTTDWWTEQLLKELGFTNLISSIDPLETARQLMTGKALLGIFTDLTVESIIKNAGYDTRDLKRSLEIQTNYFYIAASTGTDEELVLRLQTALDDMKRDGSFEEILREYVPDMLISSLLWESSTPPSVKLDKTTNKLAQGDLASFVLEENGSTGYIWDVTVLNPAVIAPVYRHRLHASEREDVMSGVPYEIQWFFRATEPGESVIVFSLRRPWESVQPVEIFAINVVVE